MIALAFLTCAALFCALAEHARRKYLREMRREERITQFEQMIGRTKRKRDTGVE